MQISRFQKLKRKYTAMNFFEKKKEALEFEKYWKRYSKKMIEAQSKQYIKKMSKLFAYIEKQGHDDEFVKNFEIKKINSIKGHGVVAKGKIPKKTIITHYAGVVRKYKGSWKDDNRYVFGFTGTPKLEDWVIDAQDICNLASFMNHSAEPNVEAFEYYDFQGPKIVFIAIRDIKENEELVYDYGDEYWKGLKEKPQ